MKKKEFMKIFNNETMWNNIKKIDKRTDTLIKDLNNIITIEIFDKLYKYYNNKSNIEIDDIRKELDEINSLLYNRKIALACRRLKGFMEDCLVFISQNYDDKAILITTSLRAKDYREYLIQNNNKIFSILNEEIAEPNNYLLEIYNYISKIDHNTSLTVYTKNIEKHNEFKNVQYTYCSITNFILYLLFDFIFTQKNLNESENSTFIIKTFTVIEEIILISFIRNYDKKKYLDIHLLSKTNNEIDEKYFSKLAEWNKEISRNIKKEISKKEINLIQNFFATYDDDLRKRGYLKSVEK